MAGGKLSNLFARGVVMIVLLGAMGGLLIGAGELSPERSNAYFPKNEEIGENPELYEGEWVVVSGTVISTDPVIIQKHYGTGHTEITLSNYAHKVETGEHVSVFGTYQGQGEVIVEQSLTRSRWEIYYMYFISFIAGVWVLWRILRYWRIDPEQYALVPARNRNA